MNMRFWYCLILTYCLFWPAVDAYDFDEQVSTADRYTRRHELGRTRITTLKNRDDYEKKTIFEHHDHSSNPQFASDENALRLGNAWMMSLSIWTEAHMKTFDWFKYQSGGARMFAMTGIVSLGEDDKWSRRRIYEKEAKQDWMSHWWTGGDPPEMYRDASPVFGAPKYESRCNQWIDSGRPDTDFDAGYTKSGLGVRLPSLLRLCTGDPPFAFFPMFAALNSAKPPLSICLTLGYVAEAKFFVVEHKKVDKSLTYKQRGYECGYEVNAGFIRGWGVEVDFNLAGKVFGPMIKKLKALRGKKGKAAQAAADAVEDLADAGDSFAKSAVRKSGSIDSKHAKPHKTVKSKMHHQASGLPANKMSGKSWNKKTKSFDINKADVKKLQEQMKKVDEAREKLAALEKKMDKILGIADDDPYADILADYNKRMKGGGTLPKAPKTKPKPSRLPKPDVGAGGETKAIKSASEARPGTRTKPKSNMAAPTTGPKAKAKPGDTVAEFRSKDKVVRKGGGWREMVYDAEAADGKFLQPQKGALRRQADAFGEGFAKRFPKTTKIGSMVARNVKKAYNIVSERYSRMMAKRRRKIFERKLWVMNKVRAREFKVGPIKTRMTKDFEYKYKDPNGVTRTIKEDGWVATLKPETTHTVGFTFGGKVSYHENGVLKQGDARWLAFKGNERKMYIDKMSKDLSMKEEYALYKKVQGEARWARLRGHAHAQFDVKPRGSFLRRMMHKAWGTLTRRNRGKKMFKLVKSWTGKTMRGIDCDPCTSDAEEVLAEIAANPHTYKDMDYGKELDIANFLKGFGVNMLINTEAKLIFFKGKRNYIEKSPHEQDDIYDPRDWFGQSWSSTIQFNAELDIPTFGLNFNAKAAIDITIGFPNKLKKRQGHDEADWLAESMRALSPFGYDQPSRCQGAIMFTKLSCVQMPDCTASFGNAATCATRAAAAAAWFSYNNWPMFLLSRTPPLFWLPLPMPLVWATAVPMPLRIYLQMSRHISYYEITSMAKTGFDPIYTKQYMDNNIAVKGEAGTGTLGFAMMLMGFMGPITANAGYQDKLINHASVGMWAREDKGMVPIFAKNCHFPVKFLYQPERNFMDEHKGPIFGSVNYTQARENAGYPEILPVCQTNVGETYEATETMRKRHFTSPKKEKCGGCAVQELNCDYGEECPSPKSSYETHTKKCYKKDGKWYKQWYRCGNHCPVCWKTVKIDRQEAPKWLHMDDLYENTIASHPRFERWCPPGHIWYREGNALYGNLTEPSCSACSAGFYQPSWNPVSCFDDDSCTDCIECPYGTDTYWPRSAEGRYSYFRKNGERVEQNHTTADDLATNPVVATYSFKYGDIPDEIKTMSGGKYKRTMKTHFLDPGGESDDREMQIQFGFPFAHMELDYEHNYGTVTKTIGMRTHEDDCVSLGCPANQYIPKEKLQEAYDNGWKREAGLQFLGAFREEAYSTMQVPRSMTPKQFDEDEAYHEFFNTYGEGGGEFGTWKSPVGMVVPDLEPHPDHLEPFIQKCGSAGIDRAKCIDGLYTRDGSLIEGEKAPAAGYREYLRHHWVPPANPWTTMNKLLKECTSCAEGYTSEPLVPMWGAGTTVEDTAGLLQFSKPRYDELNDVDGIQTFGFTNINLAFGGKVSMADCQDLVRTVPASMLAEDPVYKACRGDKRWQPTPESEFYERSALSQLDLYADNEPPYAISFAPYVDGNLNLPGFILSTGYEGTCDADTVTETIGSMYSGMPNPFITTFPDGFHNPTANVQYRRYAGPRVPVYFAVQRVTATNSDNGMRLGHANMAPNNCNNLLANVADYMGTDVTLAECADLCAAEELCTTFLHVGTNANIGKCIACGDEFSFMTGYKGDTYKIPDGRRFGNYGGVQPLLNRWNRDGYADGHWRKIYTLQDTIDIKHTLPMEYNIRSNVVEDGLYSNTGLNKTQMEARFYKEFQYCGIQCMKDPSNTNFRYSPMPPYRKFELIAEGRVCGPVGGAHWFGKVGTVERCAAACEMHDGCEYFIYGMEGSDREGKCYGEVDANVGGKDDCVNDLRTKPYNVYKMVTEIVRPTCECLKREKEYPETTIEAHKRYKLYKEGQSCDGGHQYLGQADTLDECSRLCLHMKKCEYFIYARSDYEHSKNCYREAVSNGECSWKFNWYDTYHLQDAELVRSQYYDLVKEDHDCHDKNYLDNHVQFSSVQTVDACARQCASREGCKFFLYGHKGSSKRENKCWWSQTITRDDSGELKCSKGWAKDDYDVWELKSTTAQLDAPREFKFNATTIFTDRCGRFSNTFGDGVMEYLKTPSKTVTTYVLPEPQDLIPSDRATPHLALVRDYGTTGLVSGVAMLPGQCVPIEWHPSNYTGKHRGKIVVIPDKAANMGVVAARMASTSCEIIDDESTPCMPEDGTLAAVEIAHQIVYYGWGHAFAMCEVDEIFNDVTKDCERCDDQYINNGLGVCVLACEAIDEQPMKDETDRVIYDWAEPVYHFVPEMLADPDGKFFRNGYKFNVIADGALLNNKGCRYVDGAARLAGSDAGEALPHPFEWTDTSPALALEHLFNESTCDTADKFRDGAYFTGCEAGYEYVEPDPKDARSIFNKQYGYCYPTNGQFFDDNVFERRDYYHARGMIFDPFLQDCGDGGECVDFVCICQKGYYGHNCNSKMSNWEEMANETMDWPNNANYCRLKPNATASTVSAKIGIGFNPSTNSVLEIRCPMLSTGKYFNMSVAVSAPGRPYWMGPALMDYNSGQFCAEAAMTRDWTCLKQCPLYLDEDGESTRTRKQRRTFMFRSQHEEAFWQLRTDDIEYDEDLTSTCNGTENCAHGSTCVSDWKHRDTKHCVRYERQRANKTVIVYIAGLPVRRVDGEFNTDSFPSDLDWDTQGDTPIYASIAVDDATVVVGYEDRVDVWATKFADWDSPRPELTKMGTIDIDVVDMDVSFKGENMVIATQSFVHFYDLMQCDTTTCPVVATAKTNATKVAINGDGNIGVMLVGNVLKTVELEVIEAIELVYYDSYDYKVALAVDQNIDDLAFADHEQARLAISYTWTFTPVNVTLLHWEQDRWNRVELEPPSQYDGTWSQEQAPLSFSYYDSALFAGEDLWHLEIEKTLYGQDGCAAQQCGGNGECMDLADTVSFTMGGETATGYKCVCEDGFWGVNCDKTCPDGHTGLYCRHCVSGWGNGQYDGYLYSLTDTLSFFRPPNSSETWEDIEIVEKDAADDWVVSETWDKPPTPEEDPQWWYIHDQMKLLIVDHAPRVFHTHPYEDVKNISCVFCDLFDDDGNLTAFGNDDISSFAACAFTDPDEACPKDNGMTSDDPTWFPHFNVITNPYKHVGELQHVFRAKKLLQSVKADENCFPCGAGYISEDDSSQCVRMEECDLDVDPCLHGGKCIDHPYYGYKCECPKNPDGSLMYVGSHCDVHYLDVNTEPITDEWNTDWNTVQEHEVEFGEGWHHKLHYVYGSKMNARTEAVVGYLGQGRVQRAYDNNTDAVVCICGTGLMITTDTTCEDAPIGFEGYGGGGVLPNHTPFQCQPGHQPQKTMYHSVEASWAPACGKNLADIHPGRCSAYYDFVHGNPGTTAEERRQWCHYACVHRNGLTKQFAVDLTDGDCFCYNDVWHNTQPAAGSGVGNGQFGHCGGNLWTETSGTVFSYETYYGSLGTYGLSVQGAINENVDFYTLDARYNKFYCAPDDLIVQCEQCPHGKYSDQVLEAIEPDPLSNPMVGNFSTWIAEYIDDFYEQTCFECPAGTTTNGTGATSINDCKTCPEGAELNGLNKECELCQPGKYSGAFTPFCTTCPPGKQTNTNRTSCETCAAGKYSVGEQDECTDCPVGTVSTEGSTRFAECVECAAQHYANDTYGQCFKCPSGEYRNIETEGDDSGVCDWTSQDQCTDNHYIFESVIDNHGYCCHLSQGIPDIDDFATGDFLVRFDTTDSDFVDHSHAWTCYVNQFKSWSAKSFTENDLDWAQIEANPDYGSALVQEPTIRLPFALRSLTPETTITYQEVQTKSYCSPWTEPPSGSTYGLTNSSNPHYDAYDSAQECANRCAAAYNADNTQYGEYFSYRPGNSQYECACSAPTCNIQASADPYTLYQFTQTVEDVETTSWPYLAVDKRICIDRFEMDLKEDFREKDATAANEDYYGDYTTGGVLEHYDWHSENATICTGALTFQLHDGGAFDSNGVEYDLHNFGNTAEDRERNCRRACAGRIKSPNHLTNDDGQFADGWLRANELDIAGFTSDATTGECTCYTKADTCTVTTTYSPVDASMVSSSSSHSSNSFTIGALDIWNKIWICGTADCTGGWYQIELPSQQTVLGAATQGRQSSDQWVTSWTFKYSTDGSTWSDVDGGAAFTGNSDQNTKVEQTFATSVTAKYIRFYPQSNHGYTSARMGLKTHLYVQNIRVKEGGRCSTSRRVPVSTDTVSRTNIALNQPVTCGSSRSDSPKTKANDGNTGQTHPNHWHSESTNTAKVWWGVQLPVSVRAARVKIYARDCCQSSLGNEMNVYLSNTLLADGASWPAQGMHLCRNFKTTDGGVYEGSCQMSAEYQYLYVRPKEGKVTLHIPELEVYALEALQCAEACVGASADYSSSSTDGTSCYCDSKITADCKTWTTPGFKTQDIRPSTKSFAPSGQRNWGGFQMSVWESAWDQSFELPERRSELMRYAEPGQSLVHADSWCSPWTVPTGGSVRTNTHTDEKDECESRCRAEGYDLFIISTTAQYACSCGTSGACTATSNTKYDVYNVAKYGDIGPNPAHFASRLTRTPTHCMKCSAGKRTTQDPYSDPDVRACSNPRTFINDTTFVQCKRKMFKDLESGFYTCTGSCDAGHYFDSPDTWEEEDTACKACGYGKFQPLEHLSLPRTACQSCALDKGTSGDKSVSSADCKFCPNGKYPLKGKCTACPDGETSVIQFGIRPFGWDPDIIHTRDEFCRARLDHEAKNADGTESVYCPPGQQVALNESNKFVYMETVIDQHECVECKLGTFSTGAAGPDGHAVCVKCPSGFKSKAFGEVMDSCVQCGSGKWSTPGSQTCYALATIDTKTKLESVIESMDDGANLASYGPIERWDIIAVTDMSAVFADTGTFDRNIGAWDVSRVTNMARMFDRALAFNQDISKWEVSQVTNMQSMFEDTSKFNQDLSSWDVSSVTSMQAMFRDAVAFNQDISSWALPTAYTLVHADKYCNPWTVPTGGAPRTNTHADEKDECHSRCQAEGYDLFIISTTNSQYACSCGTSGACTATSNTAYDVYTSPLANMFQGADEFVGLLAGTMDYTALNMGAGWSLRYNTDGSSKPCTCPNGVVATGATCDQYWFDGEEGVACVACDYGFTLSDNICVDIRSVSTCSAEEQLDCYGEPRENNRGYKCSRDNHGLPICVQWSEDDKASLHIICSHKDAVEQNAVINDHYDVTIGEHCMCKDGYSGIPGSCVKDCPRGMINRDGVCEPRGCVQGTPLGNDKMWSYKIDCTTETVVNALGADAVAAGEAYLQCDATDCAEWSCQQWCSCHTEDSEYTVASCDADASQRDCDCHYEVAETKASPCYCQRTTIDIGTISTEPKLRVRVLCDNSVATAERPCAVNREQDIPCDIECIHGEHRRGRATALSRSQCTCDCDIGYTGDACDRPVDCTVDTPCEHGTTGYTDASGECACQCGSSGYAGQYCHMDINECEAVPCQNGGICHNTDGAYTCECPRGFVGANCETRTCTAHTCGAEGKVCDGTAEDPNRCVADCPHGFNGTNCETDMDECAMGTHKCQVGSTCVNDVYPYRCICDASSTISTDADDRVACECKDGWEMSDTTTAGFPSSLLESPQVGTTCSVWTGICDTANPCLNGAECKNIDALDYTSQTAEAILHECVCKPGYSNPSLGCVHNPGLFCELCQNDAVCNADERTCTCQPGFYGMYCGQVDQCDNEPCQNGGICSHTAKGFRCDCDGTGYEGSVCEQNINECAVEWRTSTVDLDGFIPLAINHYRYKLTREHSIPVNYSTPTVQLPQLYKYGQGENTGPEYILKCAQQCSIDKRYGFMVGRDDSDDMGVCMCSMRDFSSVDEWSTMPQTSNFDFYDLKPTLYLACGDDTCTDVNGSFYCTCANNHEPNCLPRSFQSDEWYDGQPSLPSSTPDGNCVDGEWGHNGCVCEDTECQMRTFKLKRCQMCADGTYIGRSSDTTCIFKPSNRQELDEAVGDWEDSNEGAAAYYGDISEWDVSDITDMAQLFKDKMNVRDVDLRSWDVTKVTTMYAMFEGASRFDGNLSGWRDHSVKNMSCMFKNARAFTGKGLSTWYAEVENVEDMTQMFMGAEAFEDVTLVEMWNVGQVSAADSMFADSGIGDGLICNNGAGFSVTWYNTTQPLNFGAMACPGCGDGNIDDGEGGVDYSKAYCVESIDFCANDDPCQNGAFCTNAGLSYTCDCINGFSGDNCDECAHGKGYNGSHCVECSRPFVNNEVSHRAQCANQTCNNTHGVTSDSESWSATGDNCEPCGIGYESPAGTGQCVRITYCGKDEFCNTANAHSCTEDSAGSYTCTCKSGFEGFDCGTDIDECASRPCLNDGVCVDGIASYNCTCDNTGFDGVNCQNNIDDCAVQPCQHGGTCVDRVKGFLCDCGNVTGYTGATCNTDIDECLNQNPCKQGATCVNRPGGYECTCQPGWTGVNCDQDEDDCANQPCQNGGRCTDNGTLSHICECRVGYDGANCEEVETEKAAAALVVEKENFGGKSLADIWNNEAEQRQLKDAARAKREQEVREEIARKAQASKWSQEKKKRAERAQMRIFSRSVLQELKKEVTSGEMTAAQTRKIVFQKPVLVLSSAPPAQGIYASSDIPSKKAQGIKIQSRLEKYQQDTGVVVTEIAETEEIHEENINVGDDCTTTKTNCCMHDIADDGIVNGTFKLTRVVPYDVGSWVVLCENDIPIVHQTIHSEIQNVSSDRDGEYLYEMKCWNRTTGDWAQTINKYADEDMLCGTHTVYVGSVSSPNEDCAVPTNYYSGSMSAGTCGTGLSNGATCTPSCASPHDDFASDFSCSAGELTNGTCFQFELNGAANVQYDVGDTYTELNAVCNDHDGAAQTVSIDTSNVNMAQPAIYQVVYECGDHQLTRNVHVQDVTKPTIAMNPCTSEPCVVEAGTTFSDPGFVCTDDYTPTLSLVTSTTNNVDENTLGSQTIVYSCQDLYLNTDTATRHVTVVDTTAPQITISGGNSTHEAGTAYTDPGATCSDTFDSSPSMSTSGTVDSQQIGIQIITYTCADSESNTATVRRFVTVQDTVNGCASSPCKNGATCEDAIGGYTCECVAGWEGTDCDQEKNMCDPNPCMTGHSQEHDSHTCTPSFNNYTCTCDEGHTGRNCDTILNCVEHHDCGDHGAATGIQHETHDQEDGCGCNCDANWSGDRCDVYDGGGCHPNPCHHGGNCTDGEAGVTCECPDGFSGDNCETSTGGVVTCDLYSRSLSQEACQALKSTYEQVLCHISASGTAVCEDYRRQYNCGNCC